MKAFAAFVLAWAALVLPDVALADAAEPQWNQERAAALAHDLVAPIEALEADLESRPPVPGKEATHATIVTAIERLRLRAKELAQRLVAGAGRAETVALFREVAALQSQAAKQAREYPAPFDVHVYVDRVDAIMIELARYYGKPSDLRDESNR